MRISDDDLRHSKVIKSTKAIKPNANNIGNKVQNDGDNDAIIMGEQQKKIISVDNKETGYKFCIFKSVEENVRIIKKNVFTGRKANVKGTGLKVFAPWYKIKTVDISMINIDYPQKKFMSFSGFRDGMQITGKRMTVDAALTIRITDPKKYELKSRNVEQELFVLLEDILRVFVAKHTSDELMGGEFNIKTIDPRHPEALNEEDRESRLDKFAKRYGLSVTQLYIKKVALPESLIDDYEKLDVQRIKNKTRREEAETNKEIMRLNTEGKMYNYEALANTLKKAGLSSAQIVDLINTENLSNGKATVIINKGTNQSSVLDSNLIASIVATINSIKNSDNSESVNINQLDGEEQKPKSR